MEKETKMRAEKRECKKTGIDRDSTGVKNEKMDITSHTKCRMVLENSLGKGLRTQPVLSLILVVICG